MADSSNNERRKQETKQTQKQNSNNVVGVAKQSRNGN